MQITGNNFLVLAVLTFVALMLLFEGLYLLWKASRGPEAKKLQRRLLSLSAAHDRTPEARVLKQRLTEDLPPLERLLLNIPRSPALDQLLLQSGLNWTAGKLVTWSLGAGCAALVGTAIVLRQPLPVVAVAGVVATLLPTAFVHWQRTKRMRKIEQQLPDALDLLGRGLRAGHAFSSTLKMAGEELPEPIGGEFRTTHDEINFGVSLQQALTNLSQRVPGTDMRYFVVAVLIQRESGGNLTEVLANLSRLVRERLKLFARIRVLTSEGRLSAWILVLMPFFLAGILFLTNPKFMTPLWTDPIGIAMIKTLLLMMLAGVVVLRKIVRIRV